MARTPKARFHPRESPVRSVKHAANAGKEIDEAKRGASSHTLRTDIAGLAPCLRIGHGGHSLLVWSSKDACIHIQFQASLAA